MKRLGYKNEEAQLELAVRMQAAQSLGRLRARKAARDIEKMLGEEDVTARDTYAKALVLMGERAAPSRPWRSRRSPARATPPGRTPRSRWRASAAPPTSPATTR